MFIAKVVIQPGNMSHGLALHLRMVFTASIIEIVSKYYKSGILWTFRETRILVWILMALFYIKLRHFVYGVYIHLIHLSLRLARPCFSFSMFSLGYWETCWVAGSILCNRIDKLSIILCPWTQWSWFRKLCQTFLSYENLKSMQRCVGCSLCFISKQTKKKKNPNRSSTLLHVLRKNGPLTVETHKRCTLNPPSPTLSLSLKKPS